MGACRRLPNVVRFLLKLVVEIGVWPRCIFGIDKFEFVLGQA